MTNLKSEKEGNHGFKSIVVGKDEGDSFWQPKHAGGYITIKVSPWNIDDTRHTIFMQELPPGGIVREHYHEDHEEIFIGLAGKGVVTMEDKEFEFGAETVFYVSKQTRHSIKAVGDIPLKFMVVISPPGLEERLKLMGKPRKPSELPPEPFESGAPSEGHGVKRS
jgi:mannose-6-phosphate isomerase-like protein (cupin superfamily)